MKNALPNNGSDNKPKLHLASSKKSAILNDEQLEDAGLIKAMKSGRTGKLVNTSKFLSDLK